jgi:8-oxo-dGTP pyrophosphatase MutT (NUDIX family)
MTGADIHARLRALTQVSLAHADHRPAAVLVPIEPGRGVWLTRRSNNLPSHAGQVAFPGGKIDAADQSPEAAALREAHEEIALNPADAEILGRMDDYITGTGFHITPILALVRPGTVFVPAADEVAAVFCLPFETLLDPAAPARRTATFRGERREFWVWPEQTHFIWGATAEILVNLARVLRGDP